MNSEGGNKLSWLLNSGTRTLKKDSCVLKPIKHISEGVHYRRIVWFERGVFPLFWVRVFIINIVSDTYELLPLIRAGY